MGFVTRGEDGDGVEEGQKLAREVRSLAKMLAPIGLAGARPEMSI